MSTALSLAGLIVLGVGLALIITGVVLAILEDRRVTKAAQKAAGATGFAPQSLADTISSLAKLAEALLKYSLGMRLVFIGVLLVIIGGAIGGVGGLI
jgi:uncharacterized membrane protein